MVKCGPFAQREAATSVKRVRRAKRRAESKPGLVLNFRNLNGITTQVLFWDRFLKPPLLWPLYRIHDKLLQQLPNDKMASSGLGRCVRLVFAGAVLDDLCRSLADYNIQADDTVDYVLEDALFDVNIMLPVRDIHI